MEWKILELGERSDEEWVEMAKETGGKRKFSVVGSKRALSFKRRLGVVSNTRIVRSTKIHLYSGRLVLKSAIKIANLIFFKH